MRFDHIFFLLTLPVPDWLFWIVIVGGGSLVVLLFVIFPILIFLAALFEKIRIPTYDPEPPENIQHNPALVSVLNDNFDLIGHFTDGDKGFRRGVFSFALSTDGLMLVRILHGKIMGRIDINTRYPDGRWLITLTNSGMSDFSGLELRDTLHDAPFAALLQYHQSRLAGMNQAPVPFLPDIAVADARQHLRDVVHVLVNAGFARYKSPDRSIWKFTLKGALRHLLRLFLELPDVGTRASAALPHDNKWIAISWPRASNFWWATCHHSLHTPHQ
jgi:hypothetical protein